MRDLTAPNALGTTWPERLFHPSIPPVTANLLFDVNPDDRKRLSVSGGLVDAMTSRVGTDVVANTLALRPAISTLNSRLALLYAGTEYLIDATSSVAAALAGTTAYSLYIVGRPTDVTGTHHWLALKQTSPIQSVLQGSNGGNAQVQRIIAGAANTVAAAGFSINTSYVFAVVFSGTTVSVWLNNSLIINAVASTDNVTGLDGLVLGAGWYGAFTGGFVGLQARTLIYSGAHTSQNVADTTTFLRNYYGF